MSDFDRLWDLQMVLGDHVIKTIDEFMRADDWFANAPHRLQAAMCFAELVCPAKCWAWAQGEESHVLAKALVVDLEKLNWGTVRGRNVKRKIEKWIERHEAEAKAMGG